MPLDHTKPQTLASAITVLEQKDGLTQNQRRDMISAINRVATYLHRSPADFPTDAPTLRKQLATIHPSQAGVSAKSLSNVKTALTKALQVTGHLPPTDPKANPNEAWEGFLSHCTGKLQALAFSRLINYCVSRSFDPDGVTDELMSAFQGHLDARLLGKDPAKLCKELAQAWNGIVTRHNLPLASLTYEKNTQFRTRPLSSYPASLQDEIKTYLGRLSHADMFDEDGPADPLRPTSLRNTEAHLRQYLDALAASGRRAETFTSLGDVITAEDMSLAFNAINDRRDTNATPVGLHNIAATLVAMARHHIKVAPEKLDAISRIKKKVAPKVSGMSKKNHELLLQFNDWRNVVSLISLPDVLMERAMANSTSRTYALLAMHSATIAILLSCPMRVKNLAALDLDRHLFPQRNGTHTTYTIRIDGAEVKNGESIVVVLNPHNSQLLHRYITRFRSLISVASGTAVFPKASDGSPRGPDNFSNALKAQIYRETGLTVHTHLFRHITAMLYLRERPEGFETVRRLLKHKQLQTTMDFYAPLSNQWAHEHYDDVVLSKWGSKS